MVSGLNEKTDAISPDMQNPHWSHLSVPWPTQSPLLPSGYTKSVTQQRLTNLLVFISLRPEREFMIG